MLVWFIALEALADWFPWCEQDFANLGLAEIREQISSRRNKIYFLMEEVRRLRVQQRIKVRQSLVWAEACIPKQLVVLEQILKFAFLHVRRP